MATEAETDYVFARGANYYARLVIPADLRKTIGQNEFQKALKTKRRGDAVLAAQPWLQKWRRIMAVATHARNSGLPFVNADRPDITERNIIRVDEVMRELSMTLLTQSHASVKTNMIDARHWLEYLDSGEADFTTSFKNFMAKSGIFITEDSTLWKTRYPTSVAMFTTGIEKFIEIRRNREAERIRSMSVDEYVAHTTAPAPKPATVNRLMRPSDASDTITETFKLYLKNNPHIEANRDELDRYNKCVDSFVDFLGEDKPANYVSWSETNKFLLACAGLPVLRGDRSGMKFTKALAYARANPDVKKLSQKTINDWRVRLARVFDIPVRAGLSATNHFRNQQVKVGEKSIKKKPFSNDQIKTIINAVSKQERKERYWITMFCLYHGCRVSEIADRKTADLKQSAEGIWYIHISDAKNDQSDRKLPVHAKLIELGFLDYVKGLNRKPSEYLFSGFNEAGRIIDGSHRASREPSQQFSKWFNEWLGKECKIDDDQLTLHSFRHLWITTAQDVMERRYHLYLSGHMADSIHDGTYTHANFVASKAALDKINFDFAMNA